MATTTDVKPASDRQRAFLQTLLTRKLVPAPLAQSIELQLALSLSVRQASSFIDALLRLPDQASAPVEVLKPAAAPVERGDLWPSVPEGRYAVVDPEDQVLKFYAVDKPREGRWAGWTFLAVFASDERHPVKAHETKQRILDLIAANPEAASARFGQEMGSCGICGRTLTDETSRARGIGPVCAQRLGWGHPADPAPDNPSEA